MAETTVRGALTPVQWDDKYFTEYVRENPFSRYMGVDEGAIIQLKDDLGRKKGDAVVFASVRRLKGDGVEGNEVLEGNEDELDARGLNVRVRPLRNAVVVTEWDEQKSAIELREAAKWGLKNWSLEKLRDEIIRSLGQVALTAAGRPIPFISATATQRNTWLTNNTDRVQFGNSVANTVSGDAAASMANVDATNDKLSTAVLTLAKRRARQARREGRPAFRPYRTRNGLGQEWYLVLTNSFAFRDLQADPVMQQANRDARERNVDTNPIFTGGDLVYDGMVIREIPELDQYMSTGAGGIQVGPTYLLGAQAVGAAWAQRTKSTTDVRDYGFRNGVGIQEMRGIAKLQFGVGEEDSENLVDHGVYTIFTAAVADA